MTITLLGRMRLAAQLIHQPAGPASRERPWTVWQVPIQARFPVGITAPRPLFAETLIAIDGSKFKAVNTRDKNYTQSVIKRRMEQVEASISRYLAALDTADRHEPGVTSVKVERLQERLAKLRVQMRHLQAMEVAVQASPDGQVFAH